MKKIALIFLLMQQSITHSQNNLNGDWANLNKYQKENQATTTSSKNIVFMGDSITEFWKVNDSIFFSENPFINRGISGQTTSQMAHRFQQDVINLKPSTVVILAGINDIAENSGPISLNEILNNIIKMVALANENQIKAILCSVLPANKFYWNPKIKPADKVIELNTLIENYALENNIPYVDYYSAMVDSNKGLQLQYGEDGVHPNLLGYKVMEGILLPYLKIE